MRRSLGLKLILIGVLTALLLAPLGMIESVIGERAGYRQQAVRDIASSYAEAQQLTGPVLILPVEERYVEIAAAADGKTPSRRVERTDRRQLVVYPETLDLRGRLKVMQRYRGLHKVEVYELPAVLSGTFRLPDPAALRTHAGSSLAVGPAAVAFGVSDARGLLGTPRLTVEDVDRPLQQGGLHARLPAGVHAQLADLEVSPRSLPFRLDLTLGGTQSFEFVPLGRTTTVMLESDWPHPQFGGRFLPMTREVTAAGFTARWSISALATRARAQFAADKGEALEALSVTAVEPVSIYLMAERATKYGVLFVVLTFGGFFLYEVLRQLRLHAIQYILSGLALAVFFLLLVSLSEHMRFAWAYLAAAGACVALFAVYLAAVLRSWGRGLAFAGGLALLYAALYGLLLSEQNALVLGALLLFAILAAVMLGTRHVDWHAIAAAPAAGPASPGEGPRG